MTHTQRDGSATRSGNLKVSVMTRQNKSQAAVRLILMFGVANLSATLASSATAQALLSTNQAAANVPSAPQSSDNSGFDACATGGWGGARQWLADKGITANAQLLLEGFDNAQGGRRAGATWASTFDLNVAFDPGHVSNWKGGEFYVDLEDHAGRDPSTDLVGDLQNFDKQNFRPYFQIYELWFQQQLFNQWFHLKAGKWDANDDFSVIDNGLVFINSSDHVTPTLLAFPTTPDPMPGAGLYLTPGNIWHASFAAFYANRSDTFGDVTGHPQSIQPTDNGTLLIGETGLRWQRAPLLGKDGNLKFGAWGNTGTFTRFDGTQQKGADGFYAIFDQTLWQPHGEPAQGRGVRTFVSPGWTQSSVSIMDWNMAGGVTWTGPLAARAQDVVGFSANYAQISPQAGLPRSYELELEWLYQAQFTKWATLMPDFQFIIHPGGEYPNAVVGTLDLTIQF
jgi:porin